MYVFGDQKKKRPAKEYASYATTHLPTDLMVWSVQLLA